jgi:hypothetical protein
MVMAGSSKQYSASPMMVVVSMLEYMPSSRLHLTLGSLRRNRSPSTLVQSNVENADSMLPWNVKIKMDKALATKRRMRLADLAN